MPSLRYLVLFLSSCLLPFAGAAPLDRNDVEFARADGKPLLLDLHIPDGNGPFPAVVVVHGGAFNMGDKRSFVTPLFTLLAHNGFAWFTINYRLAPQYRFPAPVEDVESAIRWLRANAAKYRVDPKRIALAGESAGAYLVAYVGTHQTPATRVAAIVDFYGPVDMPAMQEVTSSHPERFDQAKSKSHRERTGDFFSVEGLNDTACTARMRAISPITAVNAGMPPFLVIHGSADEQVPYEQSPAFCDAIRKAGAHCDLITVENGRHGMLNWENWPQMESWKPRMIEWLQKTLAVR